MRPSNWQFSELVIRRFCAGLMMLSVLTRAIVPAGFIPAIDGATGSGLVICTAHGTRIIVDHTQGPVQPDEKRGDHHDCSTLCSPVAVAGAVDAGPLAPRYATALHWPRFDFVTPPARAGPLFSIRGPPIAV
jgi:hypothetical protein